MYCKPNGENSGRLAYGGEHRPVILFKRNSGRGISQRVFPAGLIGSKGSLVPLGAW